MRKEKKYILAVDQSTTGTKAILFDREGEAVHKCYLEHRQYYPRQSWVEHDALELLENVRTLIYRVLDEAKALAEEVASIALTNQRETVLIWDKTNGKPVYHAIVWQCNRGIEICRRLGSQEGFPEKVKEVTGLPLSEYFSAAKMAWIVENIPGVRESMEEDRLLCGTIDSWLTWNLSVEKVHVTDYTNASRTQLFDLRKCCWDLELIKAFSLKESMFPALAASDEIVGHMQMGEVLVPISGLIGDSQGALFAQTGFEDGIKVTYGTGSSVMYNVGARYCATDQLAVSVACACQGTVNYALEGNINSTGATLKWMADQMRLVDSVGEVEELAGKVSDAGGVYLVPAFSGLGAPYWEGNAKAILYGMDFGTTKEHIVRAMLESIAYQIRDVVDCVEESAGVRITQIRADGKPTENQLLMQFQADILKKEIVVSRVTEASAYGSTLLAGLAVGFWKKEEIPDLLKTSKHIVPRMTEEKVGKYYEGWKRAVAVSIGKQERNGL